MHYTGPLEVKRAAVWRDRSELLGMRETANELCRPLCAVEEYTKSEQGRSRTNELSRPLCAVVDCTKRPREK